MKKLIFGILLALTPMVVLAQDGSEGGDNYSTISTVVNLVLGAVGIFFGAAWSRVKGKLEDIKNVVKVSKDAIADDNVTAAEAKAIVEAVQRLLGKK